ncbi:MAG: response regulator transcription factor [Anaerolineae bacterium]
MATIIMIVANDKQTAASLAGLFTAKEFSVFQVHSGRQALLQSKTRKPDAVIVDATSSRLNSRRLCHALRLATRAVVIALVGSQAKGEQLRDAHDFVLKSTVTRKFVLRVKSVLDRRPPRRMQVSGLTLDMEKRRVLRSSKPHKLTPKEFDLLRLLMEHPDEIVSRETIMHEIWDTDYLGDTRTLDVHIRWLREKIEEDASRPVRLVTVRGEGYRLESKPRA